MGAVFIDFQKAFDCVSHSILLYKLELNFGIIGNLLAWLRDYLSEREQLLMALLMSYSLRVLKQNLNRHKRFELWAKSIKDFGNLGRHFPRVTSTKILAT